jgi:hypothetical protein
VAERLAWRDGRAARRAGRYLKTKPTAVDTAIATQSASRDDERPHDHAADGRRTHRAEQDPDVSPEDAQRYGFSEELKRDLTLVRPERETHTPATSAIRSSRTVTTERPWLPFLRLGRRHDARSTFVASSLANDMTRLKPG